jgi:hypothetical protein
MMPKWHVLAGAIFSLLLIKFFDIGWSAGLVIFLSSVFIDIDHYALYVLKERRIHPGEFWKWSIAKTEKWKKFSKKEKELHKGSHFLLHGVEGLLLLFILSFFWITFFWIFIGFGLHLFLDLIDKIFSGEHPAVKSSQIWLWQRNKKKKKVLR